MTRLLHLTLSCAAAILTLNTANADTITVTTDIDLEGGVWNCTEGSNCTLRYAISTAAAGDTITFDSNFTIGLSRQITIDKHLIIDGDLDDDQVADVTIYASDSSRIFFIENGLLVTLDGVKIREGTLEGSWGGGISIGTGNITNIKNSIFAGNTSDRGGGGIVNLNSLLYLTNTNFVSNQTRGSGGAILNFGTLIINNCDISQNKAFGRGGGIMNHADAAVTINASFLSNNLAVRDCGICDTPLGGGVYNMGEISIRRSTFEGNQTQYHGAGGTALEGEGGALYNAQLGVATIDQILFTGNRSKYGGAILNNGDLEMNNSTVSQNYAYLSGGGIYHGKTATTYGLTIRNTTIYNNATTNTIGTGTSGLHIGSATATGVHGEHITNSIIASSSLNSDCTIIGPGSLETNSHNLIEDGSCSPALNDAPLLESLADNGGPTLTHAIETGSPAINAGSNAYLLPAMTTDQRGVGYPRIRDNTVDIGAYEYSSPGKFFIFKSTTGKTIALPF